MNRSDNDEKGNKKYRDRAAQAIGRALLQCAAPTKIKACDCILDNLRVGSYRSDLIMAMHYQNIEFPEDVEEESKRLVNAEHARIKQKSASLERARAEKEQYREFKRSRTA